MKKALVPSTLVTILIIILSFVALGYAVTRITGIIPSTLDKEACRDSIMLRANAILKGTGVTPQIIPIKCKTEEIVVSSPIEEDIQKTVANAMYDCWWMLGEGKIDFLKEEILESKSCLICSNIKFKDKARNKKIDIAGYMQREVIPGKNITYMEFLTDGTKSVYPTQTTINPLDTNKDYSVIFMGFRGSSDKPVKGAIGGSIVGVIIGPIVASIVCGPATPLCSAGVFALTVVGGAKIGLDVGITSFLINSYMSTINCNGEKNGCYMMILAPYTAENIGKYCQKIESIP